MLRITLKKGYTTTSRLVKQFQFLRYLGVSRWNACKLLMRIQQGHMVLIQTLTDVKRVYHKFYHCEEQAHLVGFERDIYQVVTTLREGPKFKLVQKLTLMPYIKTVCAHVYVTRKPV